MAMVIKNNAAAQAALGELKKNNDKLGKDLKKVASGMKINGAADDASGYSISERMRTQLRGLTQDNANAQNASSLLKTADGAISSTVDLLKTMKEKAINAANDTNTDNDRATIQKEIDQSIDQLEDNA
ncbi:MAG: flagellin, partial [Selenomonas sp.]